MNVGGTSAESRGGINGRQAGARPLQRKIMMTDSVGFIVLSNSVRRCNI